MSPYLELLSEARDPDWRGHRHCPPDKCAGDWRSPIGARRAHRAGHETETREHMFLLTQRADLHLPEHKLKAALFARYSLDVFRGPHFTA
jgi:hypothetical protein